MYMYMCTRHIAVSAHTLTLAHTHSHPSLTLTHTLTPPTHTLTLTHTHTHTHTHSFICYATSTFDHILEPLYMQLTHTPEEKRNGSLIDAMLRKFNICASVLSQHLSGRSYVCGDKFTAADCVIGYNIWWASVIQGGTLLQDYPVLQEYLARLKSRPAFEATMVGRKPVKPSGGSL